MIVRSKWDGVGVGKLEFKEIREKKRKNIYQLGQDFVFIHHGRQRGGKRGGHQEELGWEL